MKILFFDCFAGISGDMALGALLDCGVPVEALREGLKSLPVSGWHIAAEPVLRDGIHAMNIAISLYGQTDEQELAAAHEQHDHHHAHNHHAHNHHDHSHDHHAHEHEHHHHPHVHGRSMAEIRQLIEASELSPRVKRDSLKIFGKIAEAEAKIHHSTPEEVHFHEIGGVDSLLDICGVAWCLEYLGVDEVHCSALPYSTGFVDCAHGRMPVPAPATLLLLEGFPTLPAGHQGEMVTPTGAGILAALCRPGTGQPPPFAPSGVGVGCGKKRFADRPNLLRAIVGEVVAPREQLNGLEWRELSLVACNIDDMNPELYPLVLERLLEAGALDAWLSPIQMKKGRPAHTLSALCAEDVQNAVISAMLRETSTLGVRVETVRRAALPRSVATIETSHGPIRVKRASWPEGQVERAVPEWGDVERLARQSGAPAREIYEDALRAAG